MRTLITRLFAICLIIVSVTFDLFAQDKNLYIWKYSSQPSLVKEAKIRDTTLTQSRLDSFNLFPGVYVVYIGDNKLQNYIFPEEENQSTYSLYEDELKELTQTKKHCYQETDTLPDGKWFKINISSKGHIELLKEKNVWKGLLHGNVILYKENDPVDISSHMHSQYINGFLVFREIRNKKGKVTLKGTYGECNKVIEETIWNNGKVWKKFKHGKVWEYDSSGKLLSVKKTDPWGNY